MACDSPLIAYRDAKGGVSFTPKAGGVRFPLACGQCRGCRLERSRQWAVRCVHESKMHDLNCFITLTYDDAHLPADGWLDYRHFQLFLKRLRKYFSVKDEYGDVWNMDINFYMCGEYGENFGRPHYHACLFGLDFPDRVLARKSASGFFVYSSAILTKLWGLGDCYVGDMSFESAAYCARYIMKKLTGKAVEKLDSRRSIKVDTGEIFVPEFTHMSLQRPIGKSFFNKYRSDIFPHDRVVIRGQVSLPPRYYGRIYRRVDPDSWEDVCRKRGRFNAPGERSANRLVVKAVCREARISRLVRSSF